LCASTSSWYTDAGLRPEMMNLLCGFKALDTVTYKPVGRYLDTVTYKPVGRYLDTVTYKPVGRYLDTVTYKPVGRYLDTVLCTSNICLLG
jgi:hypothetical protein